MIERHWKDTCKAGHADEYRAHLVNDTLQQLAAIECFEGLEILQKII